MFGNRDAVSAAIAASASATNVIAMGDRSPVSLMLPTGSASFTASTVVLAFPVSNDGTNYDLLRDNSGAIVTLTIAANNTLGATHLDSEKFRGWSSMKLEARNASAAAAVVQGAERTFSLGLDRVR